MDAEAIGHIRRFNRTVGEALGVTRERFLGRTRPPGESRILWEIGGDGIDVRLLRRRLALDSGYVARVLRSLARQGLVRVRVHPEDRRVRRATLTTRGVAERAHLDRRSNVVAAGVLDPLGERERRRLIAAMTEVERLLRASMVRFVVADPKSSDSQWCLAQYFGELDKRFDRGFDPARSISADAEELTPPAGLLLLGYMRDRPVGCGALKLHGRAPAELKRMWIAPAARGLGLGATLLAQLEQHAWDAGARTVRLETNRSLEEAVRLYRCSGYVEVKPFNDEPYAHHWFEKQLPRRRTRRAGS
jgi:DNA-binding MarR family transcriptional regulator/GNAT superfamily N-acetyltransferase